MLSSEVVSRELVSSELGDWVGGLVSSLVSSELVSSELGN